MAGDFSLQLRHAADDLRNMSTEVRRSIRPTLQRAAEPIVAQAQANASWSRRIPGAIRLSTLKRGVEIRVSAKKAPHARPLEGIRGNHTFRHPVMGDRSVWVTQLTRPFLQPAARVHGRRVTEKVVQMIDRAARNNNFR